MKRSSKYYPLRYVVECKPTNQAFFEVIAAFNVDVVALDYAKACSRSTGYAYRVMKRHGNALFTEIYAPEF